MVGTLDYSLAFTRSEGVWLFDAQRRARARLVVKLLPPDWFRRLSRSISKSPPEEDPCHAECVS
jgi:hypothetical protein